MTNATASLDIKRRDAKELISILKRIPEDKRKEILGIVKGFALCAETDNRKAM